MIYAAIILYMGIMSGYSGGSLPYAGILDKLRLTWLPELLFALPFGLIWLPLLDGWWQVAVLPIIGWSYIWMQTGHANALPWGKGGHDPQRTNTLSPFIKRLADRRGIKYYSTNYARLFMAVKGFLIGLPVGGVTLAIGWPLGYEIGNRTGNHAVSEVAAGFFAGCCLALALFIRQHFVI